MHHDAPREEVGTEEDQGTSPRSAMSTICHSTKRIISLLISLRGPNRSICRLSTVLRVDVAQRVNDPQNSCYQK
jgi:hypothetical protein